MRVWTPGLIVRLEGLLEDGLTDREAAARLGLTAYAVSNARERYAIARRDQILLTSTQVAALLGCSRYAVMTWAAAGYLPGDQRPGRGGHDHWFFGQTQVLRFLEDERHWHRWHPEDITDARIQRWASGLRGVVRYLTYDEAAVRRGVSRWTIRHWVRTGRLRGYRGQQTLVREDELVRMALPDIGSGGKRSWAPCVRCGDPDGRVPARGRTPGRRDGRAWGYEGRLCETCYARLRAAACKQRQKEAA